MQGILNATRKLGRTVRVARVAGAFCLASLIGFGAEKTRGSDEALPGVFVYQRVLDNKGRETRDLYANQNYTNEVRVAIDGQLPPEASVAGMRFVLRASSNVRVVTGQELQERPVYGKEDIFAGNRLSTNNVVRFGGESVRMLDIPTDAVGVVEGNKVIARYGFSVAAPATYAITDFMIEQALVRHPAGIQRAPKVKLLKAVAVHATYQKPAMAAWHIDGNDHEYPGITGVEFYFSVRNQRVFLEKSPDLQTWTILYSNQQTCPSFTLKAFDLEREPRQFFRIRPGSAAGQ